MKVTQAILRLSEDKKRRDIEASKVDLVRRKVEHAIAPVQHTLQQTRQMERNIEQDRRSYRELKEPISLLSGRIEMHKAAYNAESKKSRTASNTDMVDFFNHVEEGRVFLAASDIKSDFFRRLTAHVMNNEEEAKHQPEVFYSKLMTLALGETVLIHQTILMPAITRQLKSALSKTKNPAAAELLKSANLRCDMDTRRLVSLDRTQHDVSDERLLKKAAELNELGFIDLKRRSFDMVKNKASLEDLMEFFGSSAAYVNNYMSFITRAFAVLYPEKSQANTLSFTSDVLNGVSAIGFDWCLDGVTQALKLTGFPGLSEREASVVDASNKNAYLTVRKAVELSLRD